MDRATQRHLEGLTAVWDHCDVLAGRFAAVPNPDALFAQAFDQGMAAFLLARLEALAVPLPPELLASVRRRVAQDRLWNRRLAVVHSEAVTATADAGVLSLVLKGLPLGERLYGDPGLRPTTDLDLLVSRADLEKSCAVLVELGYRPAGDGLHHRRLERGELEHIEVHDLASSGFGTEIASEPLLENAAHLTGVFRIPAPEDEFVYLAVHAARHRFSRLLWLWDLRTLLEQRTLDWDLVARRTHDFGVRGAVAVTGEALRQRLGMTLPSILDGIFPRSRRVRLAAGYFSRDVDRLFFGTRFRAVGRLSYRALLGESPGAGARFWARSLWEGAGKLIRGRPRS